MRLNPQERKQARSRRILYAAYPLLPVSDRSCGGAEQALWLLEREMARTFETTVIACAGSSIAGTLYSLGPPGSGNLPSARAREAALAAAATELVSVRSAVGRGFDLVHDHSGSLFAYAHRVDIPVLATLHLPRSFYPPQIFSRRAKNCHFNCVSQSQAASFQSLPGFLGVVSNGIAVERFPVQTRKRNYLLWLGRICEEKGTHIALDVAEAANVPIVLAGVVYPLAYHHWYFQWEIAPRLKKMGDRAKFIALPSFERKVELLRNARALLVTSLAAESSSLVAMEAAACGTPVIAFRNGALPEVVCSGVTGILVNHEKEMRDAIAMCGRMDARRCGDYARANFASGRMVRDYQRLYDEIMGSREAITPKDQPVAA